MSILDFNAVEETLFVPMLGRIYASQSFPHILNDPKALELKNKLPPGIKGKDTQTQYTLMANAVRSANMDKQIHEFVQRNPNGIIAELGCGLETAFFRNSDIKNQWYEIDLPNVIEYRKTLLPESSSDIYIGADAFTEDWLKQIRNDFPTEPILVTAGGFFYYFEKAKIMELFKLLKKYHNIEIIFDVVNSQGMKRISHYMKQMGHGDIPMYFYVDKAEILARQAGAYLVKEEPYYKYTNKKGLKFITKATMNIADIFMMVKMIHLKFK